MNSHAVSWKPSVSPVSPVDSVPADPADPAAPATGRPLSGIPGGGDDGARRRLPHRWGFWIAAAALLVNMGFSAVPTPLYVLYQQRDHFSAITVTAVYAIYAVGVIGSLFLGGHVSDWVGRKRIFVPALLVNVVSAAVFVSAPSLTGLYLARVLSGISVGLTTATATAYLGELNLGSGRTASPRRAHVTATAANLGGIGVGPLVAGLLAQFAPWPLQLPYLVFAAALAVLALLVAVSPETIGPQDDQIAYRPQRVAVPRRTRKLFFAATGAGMAAFAVYGVFNSLAPSFLADTMHQTSHAVAGAVAFAAFASGAVAQITLARWDSRTMLRRGAAALAVGLALLTSGLWTANVGLFVAGGIVAGASGGLIFRAAVSAAASAAPPESRAEAMAGFFLGAYVGLSVPVVGLGVAAEYWSAQDALLVFVVVVMAATVLAVRAVIRAYDDAGIDAGAAGGKEAAAVRVLPDEGLRR
ncbi:MAG TPA: MFS transporter [Actinospica sp.]|nr:MFS transporter [Actinospica sp.]